MKRSCRFVTKTVKSNSQTSQHKKKSNATFETGKKISTGNLAKEMTISSYKGFDSFYIRPKTCREARKIPQSAPKPIERRDN